MYRPYKAYSVAIVIQSIMTVLAWMPLVVLFLLNVFAPIMIAFLILGILSIVLLKYSIECYRVVFLIDTNGFVIKSSKRIIYKCESWNDFSIVYNCYDYKGHRYFVLSKVKLDSASLRKLIYSSRVHLNGNIVLYLNDFDKCVEDIVKLISNNLEVIRL
jgi:hypothetical protein